MQYTQENSGSLLMMECVLESAQNISGGLMTTTGVEVLDDKIASILKSAFARVFVLAQFSIGLSIVEILGRSSNDALSTLIVFRRTAVESFTLRIVGLQRTSPSFE